MKAFLIRLFDFIFSSRIRCSIGDLLLPGRNMDSGQLTVVSRYYDVINYKLGTDRNFSFQNAISYVLFGDRHNRVSGDDNFKKIIESYDKNGYMEKSRIELYKGLNIANGTHRMALNIFHGFWEINARVLWRNIPTVKYLDWYIARGLDKKWEKVLSDTYESVQEKLFNEGVTLVFSTIPLSDEQTELLNRILRERCKHYIVSSANERVIVRFSLYNPRYIIKRNTLFSIESESLLDEINNQLGEVIVDKARNCIEGKELFDRIKLK